MAGTLKRLHGSAVPTCRWPVRRPRRRRIAITSTACAASFLETRADIRDGSYGPTSELNLSSASKDIDEALRLSKSSAATLAPDRLTKAAFDLNLLRDRKARILSRAGQLEASLAAFEEARVERERIAALDESNLSWRLAASNVNSAAAEISSCR